jgi:hypothetical protein
VDNFENLTTEALSALATEKRDAITPLLALEAPTAEQVKEAKALAAEIEQIEGEVTRRETEAAEAAKDFADLKTRFAKSDEPEGNEPEGDEETGEEEPSDADAPKGAEDEPEDDANANEGADAAAPGSETGDARMEPQGEIGAGAKGVAALAAKTARPEAPQRDRGAVSLLAAADVPGFSSGSELSDLDALGQAVVSRMRGFTPPNGAGDREDWRQFGVASIKRPFPEDLTIDRGTDDMEVLVRASQEDRLDGGSLVAAGGWCAPSETLYDLAGDETTDGILSVPEVNVRRGGIRYTYGPQFSDFYANAGFIQTEAQAIAGTSKPCVEVSCPAFTEVRLDAVGLCIRVPILTNAAYPELINRFVSGTLVAHQHMVNANVISRIVTLAGAARAMTGIGSSAHDTLSALTLVANQRRQASRLSLNASFEVVLPFWVKDVLKDDLSLRTGQTQPVSDAQLSAYFSARNLSVQYVYDWQDLPLVDDAGTAGVNEANTYPTDFDVLMYPAGTYVKGTSDVINLNAVYDAASLATNTYTGLFMEEGILVAQMKPAGGDLVTIPVCSAGRTGAADLTCA